MSYYDLDKNQRIQVNNRIKKELIEDMKLSQANSFLKYFSDLDIYIRKAGYTAVRDITIENPEFVDQMITILQQLFSNDSELVRQTVINSFGEIAKFYPEKVIAEIEKGLFDKHSKVGNAVIGSLKKFGAIKPKFVIDLAKKYYNHPDVEIRRQVIHGIELRGRSHPEDILDTLQLAEFDPKAKIRNMVIHVLIQISYRKGSLEKVIKHLLDWKNKELVYKALDEIIYKHKIDEQFTFYNEEQAREVVRKFFKDYTN